MEKYKIFEMWERQLDRLERMSEKAEYPKAPSGLTDIMMELSDRLLREEEYGWVQYEKACELEEETRLVASEVGRLLETMTAEVGGDHKLIEQMRDLKFKADLAGFTACEFSEQLNPCLGRKMKEGDAV